jgi:hypothetical protein
MVGFVSALVFFGVNFGHFKNYHAACGEGQGQGAAVDIHKLVKGEAAGNFLNIPFGINDVIIVHKHAKSIRKSHLKCKSKIKLNMRIANEKKNVYYS